MGFRYTRKMRHAGVYWDQQNDGNRRRWSREILTQSGGDLFQRPVDLIAGDNKRRGDANRVPMCVLGEDASGLQGLTVATCTACFR